ncbi:MAG: DUF6597 domain-containing transcriptional factor [Labedaea sp.]
MSEGTTGEATTSEYGVLGPREVHFGVDRVPASADLAGLVERYWLARWALPPGAHDSVTLLPHPCVNLAFDRGLVTINGPGRERFTYEYSGRGQVFGVKFRPGAFRPFCSEPMMKLTDQARPLATLWGADAERFAADLDRAAGLPELVAVAERHLRAHWPEPDPEVAVVGRIVNALLYDRGVTRVSDVSTRFGIPPRTLQRLFERYVGVSPKWVLRRYRVHEAAARLAAGGPTATWAEVAAELGYFDQSHFIRDFTMAVGLTPAAYADACRRHQAPVSA